MARLKQFWWLAVLGLSVTGAAVIVEWIGDAGGALSLDPKGPAVISSAESAAGYPQTWTDVHGYQVTLTAPPRTVASQALATDHFLFAVAPPSQIVAVSTLAGLPQYSNIADRVHGLGLPAVSDLESLLTLNPSLLLASEISSPELLRGARAGGVPVYAMRTFVSRLDEIADSLRLVGELSGNPEAGRHAAAGFERSVREARARVPENAVAQRVLGYTYYQHCLGKGSLFDDIVTSLGAVNVGSEQGLGPSQKIDAEQVAAWNPDWIVAGSGGQSMQMVRDSLESNAAIGLTRAGKAGQLLVVEGRVFTSMSQHVLGTMHALADALYPRRGSR